MPSVEAPFQHTITWHYFNTVVGPWPSRTSFHVGLHTKGVQKLS